LNLQQHTVAITGLLVLTLCTACSNRAAKLPVYDSVPAFQMTDSRGETFDSSALRGKVWVADFIYTNCPAECPLMSAKMHRVEKQLRGQDNVRFVSFSVDPMHDTPAALSAFAKRYGAPTKQWVFLTGTTETVHQIAFATFHVGDVIGRIEHSTKFALVDKQGRIRGYYSSLGKDDLAALVADAEGLRRQGS
jgi:protein SCO1/2